MVQMRSLFGHTQNSLLQRLCWMRLHIHRPKPFQLTQAQRGWKVLKSVRAIYVRLHHGLVTRIKLLRKNVLLIPVWDSFHSLMAEVTHNETADPSMNFDQPEHSSPGEQASSWDPRASFSNNDLSESEQSLDLFRAKDAATSVLTPPASHESFSLLLTSQDRVHESVLVSPPKDVTALPKLTACSDAPVGNTTQPQEPFSSGSVGELTSEEGAGMQDTAAASEKGILEQSQITLMSLTDTSLQDQGASLTDEHPDVVRGSTDWSRHSVCDFICPFFLF